MFNGSEAKTSYLRGGGAGLLKDTTTRQLLWYGSRRTTRGGRPFDEEGRLDCGIYIMVGKGVEDSWT